MNGIKTNIIACNADCLDTIKARASKKFGYTLDTEIDSTSAVITIFDYKKYMKYVQPFIFHASLV